MVTASVIALPQNGQKGGCNLRRGIRTVLATMVALSVLSAIPVRAETALQMQSWCKDITNVRITQNDHLLMPQTFDNGFCWGAFSVFEGLGRAVLPNKSRLLGFCAPETSTRLQFIKVFLSYANQHPELVHRDFEQVAAWALINAFPCPAQAN
jgi:hypothetical protein